MIKYSSRMYKILLINFAFCQCVLAWSPFSFFLKKSHEEVIQKEIPFQTNGNISIKNMIGNISIKNIIGSITVKTWRQDIVQIKITKKSTKQEFLIDVDVKIRISNKKIIIEIKQKKESEGKVEVIIELIVPENTKVDAITKKGPISIQNLKASAKAKTEQGNIEISGVKGSIITSSDYGSITIRNASENIRAHTLNGNITIDQATKNIVAHAKKGSIYTTCKNTCSLDTISLSTQSGNIVLSLPEQVNAELFAKTKKGKITSEHFITIKPQTTQLNKKNWKRMRKEVDGTLGNGDATIKLTSGSGNIKISKVT